MVRAPCCEKIGLKKGSWTAEEDRILTHHIERYGHANWRALPRQAGLFRCGKSCRLRWINYLRPDLKRGNFTVEEEETIITLHQKYGNRWSAIAAELPGRTDNEIKNVWHTYLKKRLDSNDDNLAGPKKKPSEKKRKPRMSDIPVNQNITHSGGSVSSTSSGGSIIDNQLPSHSSDASTNSTMGYAYVPEEDDLMFLEWPEINDDFLFPNLPADQDTIATDFPDCDDMPVFSNGAAIEDNQNTEDEMDFWLRVFIESGSTGTDSIS